jgi:hypothetical protein
MSTAHALAIVDMPESPPRRSPGLFRARGLRAVHTTAAFELATPSAAGGA